MLVFSQLILIDGIFNVLLSMHIMKMCELSFYYLSTPFYFRFMKYETGTLKIKLSFDSI